MSSLRFGNSNFGFIGIIIMSIIAIALLKSCNKSPENPKTTPTSLDLADSSFLPITSGFWIDYQIDSVRYIKDIADTHVAIVKSTSFERVLFGDTIEGFSPRAIRMSYFRLATPVSPPVFSRNDLVFRNGVETIFSFQNIQRVLLHLPIVLSKHWNGHKYIATTDSTLGVYANQNFKYISPIAPQLINSFSFDSTVLVEMQNYENAIEKKYEAIILAKNIGIVSWESLHLEKQNTLNSWDFPENGLWLKKTIINWKK